MTLTTYRGVTIDFDKFFISNKEEVLITNYGIPTGYIEEQVYETTYYDFKALYEVLYSQLLRVVHELDKLKVERKVHFVIDGKFSVQVRDAVKQDHDERARFMELDYPMDFIVRKRDVNEIHEDIKLHMKEHFEVYTRSVAPIYVYLVDTTPSEKVGLMRLHMDQNDGFHITFNVM